MKAKTNFNKCKVYTVADILSENRNIGLVHWFPKYVSYNFV